MEHIKTADLCDKFSGEVEICKMEFKSFGKKTSFYGQIATVKVFEDNVLVKDSLQTIPEGYVLVVDGCGSKNCALIGDRLGEIAESRGLAGIIINGCARDTADLAKLDIGVLALGSNPLKSSKEGKGIKDVNVSFGDIEWKPGDYVYVDEDGVIISTRELRLDN